MGRQRQHAPTRFWAKVQRTHDGCWTWTGFIHDGYGRFWDGYRIVRAHRYSYTVLHGRKIPEGKIIDHLCRNRACVNPDHMEPVTNRENVIRGDSPRLTRERHAAQRQGN